MAQGGFETEPQAVLDYVDEALETLDVDKENKIRQRAINLANKGMCEYPMNYHRKVTTAGAVYLSCLLGSRKRTQEEVADALDVSPLSVRGSYADLRDNYL